MVSENRFGASGGHQRSSVTEPTRASSLAKIFVPLCHRLKWPSSPILQLLAVSGNSAQRGRRSVGKGKQPKQLCPSYLTAMIKIQL